MSIEFVVVLLADAKMGVAQTSLERTEFLVWQLIIIPSDGLLDRRCPSSFSSL
ncbi:hypothetical protein FHS54_000659 [Sphingobium vermicomposti]|uniref:Uncharacterized protein n=1 Tax=Sphingobium vermicomposti TaxID=529005 RepID=A0A846M4N4_9SPHN|nr:hypothetical protein [Sphingobium vermicomposti]